MASLHTAHSSFVSVVIETQLLKLSKIRSILPLGIWTVTLFARLQAHLTEDTPMFIAVQTSLNLLAILFTEGVHGVKVFVISVFRVNMGAWVAPSQSLNTVPNNPASKSEVQFSDYVGSEAKLTHQDTYAPPKTPPESQVEGVKERAQDGILQTTEIEVLENWTSTSAATGRTSQPSGDYYVSVQSTIMPIGRTYRRLDIPQLRAVSNMIAIQTGQIVLSFGTFLPVTDQSLPFQVDCVSTSF